MSDVLERRRRTLLRRFPKVDDDGKVEGAPPALAKSKALKMF